ncbi:MAG: prolipoprotein diacylglyceryl transferase [Clostridia bacterium]|nr:prolipoprotein diacylglyceryl transferase [Clostridia bacterium]
MHNLLAIDRVAFTLFGNPVYWYGIVITLGIILAFCLYLLLSYKRRIDFDFSLELFIWVIPMAVIFCRVFYVVPRIGDEYSLSSWEGFVDAIDISGGGLTIIGGIFGGAFGVFFCCLRNKKYSLMRVADCVVIAVLLGQIIGRWGNFFNQELYGVEVTNEALQHLPFAVFIESTGKWHYASFFFEGTLNAIGLAIALVMYFVPKKPLKNGTFSIFYLGWYGLVRGSLEFIKAGNPVTFGNSDVKVVQVICYIVFIVCIALQVLLQFGKINFETKWFEKMCASKLDGTCQKLRNIRLLSASGETDSENSQEQTAEDVSEVSQLVVIEEIKYLKASNDSKPDETLLQ